MACRQQMPRWKRAHGGAPYQLYRFMQQHGTQDFMFFLPASSRFCVARRGRCFRLSRVGLLPSIASALMGTMLSMLHEEWRWTVFYVKVAGMAQETCAVGCMLYTWHFTSKASALTPMLFIFANFTTPVLEKMLVFCRTGLSTRGVSVTDLFGEQGVPTSFTDQLSDWLQVVLATRRERPAPANRAQRKFLCV